MSYLPSSHVARSSVNAFPPSNSPSRMNSVLQVKRRYHSPSSLDEEDRRVAQQQDDQELSGASVLHRVASLAAKSMHSCHSGLTTLHPLRSASTSTSVDKCTFSVREGGEECRSRQKSIKEGRQSDTSRHSCSVSLHSSDANKEVEGGVCYSSMGQTADSAEAMAYEHLHRNGGFPIFNTAPRGVGDPLREVGGSIVSLLSASSSSSSRSPNCSLDDRKQQLMIVERGEGGEVGRRRSINNSNNSTSFRSLRGYTSGEKFSCRHQNSEVYDRVSSSSPLGARSPNKLHQHLQQQQRNRVLLTQYVHTHSNSSGMRIGEERSDEAAPSSVSVRSAPSFGLRGSMAIPPASGGSSSTSAAPAHRTRVIPLEVAGTHIHTATDSLLASTTANNHDMSGTTTTTRGRHCEDGKVRVQVLGSSSSGLIKVLHFEGEEVTDSVNACAPKREELASNGDGISEHHITAAAAQEADNHTLAKKENRVVADAACNVESQAASSTKNANAHEPTRRVLSFTSPKALSIASAKAATTVVTPPAVLVQVDGNKNSNVCELCHTTDNDRSLEDTRLASNGSTPNRLICIYTKSGLSTSSSSELCFPDHHTASEKDKSAKGHPHQQQHNRSPVDEPSYRPHVLLRTYATTAEPRTTPATAHGDKQEEGKSQRFSRSLTFTENKHRRLFTEDVKSVAAGISAAEGKRPLHTLAAARTSTFSETRPNPSSLPSSDAAVAQVLPLRTPFARSATHAFGVLQPSSHTSAVEMTRKSASLCKSDALRPLGGQEVRRSTGSTRLDEWRAREMERAKLRSSSAGRSATIAAKKTFARAATSTTGFSRATSTALLKTTPASASSTVAHPTKAKAEPAFLSKASSAACKPTFTNPSTLSHSVPDEKTLRAATAPDTRKNASATGSPSGSALLSIAPSFAAQMTCKGQRSHAGDKAVLKAPHTDSSGRGALSVKEKPSNTPCTTIPILSSSTTMGQEGKDLAISDRTNRQQRRCASSYSSYIESMHVFVAQHNETLETVSQSRSGALSHRSNGYTKVSTEKQKAGGAKVAEKHLKAVHTEGLHGQTNVGAAPHVSEPALAPESTGLGLVCQNPRTAQGKFDRAEASVCSSISKGAPLLSVSAASAELVGQLSTPLPTRAAPDPPQAQPQSTRTSFPLGASSSLAFSPGHKAESSNAGPPPTPTCTVAVAERYVRRPSSLCKAILERKEERLRKMASNTTTSAAQGSPVAISLTGSAVATTTSIATLAMRKSASTESTTMSSRPTELLGPGEGRVSTHLQQKLEKARATSPLGDDTVVTGSPGSPSPLHFTLLPSRAYLTVVLRSSSSSNSGSGHRRPTSSTNSRSNVAKWSGQGTPQALRAVRERRASERESCQSSHSSHQSGTCSASLSPQTATLLAVGGEVEGEKQTRKDRACTPSADGSKLTTVSPLAVALVSTPKKAMPSSRAAPKQNGVTDAEVSKSLGKEGEDQNTRQSVSQTADVHTASYKPSLCPLRSEDVPTPVAAITTSTAAATTPMTITARSTTATAATLSRTPVATSGKSDCLASVGQQQASCTPTNAYPPSSLSSTGGRCAAASTSTSTVMGAAALTAGPPPLTKDLPVLAAIPTSDLDSLEKSIASMLKHYQGSAATSPAELSQAASLTASPFKKADTEGSPEKKKKMTAADAIVGDLEQIVTLVSNKAHSHMLNANPFVKGGSAVHPTHRRREFHNAKTEVRRRSPRSPNTESYRSGDSGGEEGNEFTRAGYDYSDDDENMLAGADSFWCGELWAAAALEGCDCREAAGFPAVPHDVPPLDLSVLVIPDDEDALRKYPLPLPTAVPNSKAERERILPRNFGSMSGKQASPPPPLLPPSPGATTAASSKVSSGATVDRLSLIKLAVVAQGLAIPPVGGTCGLCKTETDGHHSGAPYRDASDALGGGRGRRRDKYTGGSNPRINELLLIGHELRARKLIRGEEAECFEKLAMREYEALNGK